ncbi:MAG: zinc-binding dehydrogenase [bacterium]|nr:zinc-binding dehydrogenase [bacterium]
MKAAVLYKDRTDLKIEDWKSKSPGPGEVKVRVHSCGVCGSDVHITVHKIMSLKEYPRIPGHEASGVVAEVGEGVTDFADGQRVVIAAGFSCGDCPACGRQRENACEGTGVFGFERDGAYAEEVIVPARCLVSLPDEIPFDQGAIMADAVSTPYHALKYAGRMEAGEVVAVFGCGGLGIHAVLLAKALGAGKVVAIDVDDGALQNAAAFGADDILNVRDMKHVGKTLKEKTGGVDIVLEFSGHYGNVEQSLRAMNPLGRIVMVGIGRGKITLQLPLQITSRQISLIGSFGSDMRAIPDLMQLFLDKKLDLSRSITSHHPLEELNDCLENLHHRNGNPIRYIIEPGS